MCVRGSTGPWEPESLGRWGRVLGGLRPILISPVSSLWFSLVFTEARSRRTESKEFGLGLTSVTRQIGDPPQET